MLSIGEMICLKKHYGQIILFASFALNQGSPTIAIPASSRRRNDLVAIQKEAQARVLPPQQAKIAC
jgi:hypothetical protein